MSSRTRVGNPPILPARIILTIALSALFTGTVFADEPAVGSVLNAAFAAPPDMTTEATGPLTAVDMG